MGIQPQVIIPRTDHPVSREIIAKIALFCDVEPRAVIPLETTNNIYNVPLVLEDAGLGDYIVELLDLPRRPPKLDDWRSLIDRMQQVSTPVRIALVGKYVELHDAYISVKEALTHAAVALKRKLEIEWVYSGDLEKNKGWDVLSSVDGIVVPGGFGYRGIEGKILAAEFARTRHIPYLGLCLGMQVMCIEFARNVLALEDANSSEFDSGTPHPVIDLMPDQLNVANLGGTMRLGLYPCHLKAGSKSAAAYNVPVVNERHRHRFEFNNHYRERFEAAGARFTGLSPNGQLVEIMEIADHPFMVGSQFHPEFQSRPDRPHPLFQAFIQAACTTPRKADPAPSSGDED